MLTYFQSVTLAVLRIFAAFMLWQHAAHKLFGMFDGSRADIFSGLWVVGLVEFVGSIAIGVGFLTRPFAAVVSVGLMLTYFIQYLPQGFPPDGGRLGEHVVALAFVCGFLAFAGPGRFSIEADIRRHAPGVDTRWFLDAWQEFHPQALGAFRILLGLLFAQHGLAKLGIGGDAAELLSQRWVAGVIELFGGGAIALGLFTRPIAFIASGQMAFAYFLSHAQRAFFPFENAGDRAALFCFFFLYVVTAGPGRWALDGLLGKQARGGSEKVPVVVRSS